MRNPLVFSLFTQKRAISKLVAILLVLAVACGAVGLYVFDGSARKVFDSIPQKTVSGKVASCSYSWFTDETTIVFSDVGEIVFKGNYDLKEGSCYTITYTVFAGNQITNIKMGG